ncbi:hypothetical protein HHI36_015782 [Cryptolaemus montrouzieri]|uniref:Uncharacterized protein n=1 Tax=Cryptolaemus montrouzieri TaxID=559131 RepID=A0ABD2N7X0_9CUCU
MNTTLLILSFLLFGCEAKSLDLNSKVSENSVVDEIAKNSSKVTQKEIELEELKKDIGKVGNRLEGIVYEVLKDFFSKDFELNETQANNHSMKETESVTEILLKKYHPTFFENNENRSSVIDDEVIHTKSSGTTGSPIDQTATTFPDTTSTSTTPQIFENELAPTSSTQEVNTLQNTLNSMEPESISTTQVSNKDSTPETTEIPISTTSETIQIPHKLRKRRMALENPELSRSNENFIEPNPEPPRRSSNSRRKFQNPEEPIIPDFQIAETEKLNPEQPKRRNSKAKLEHFEGPIMTDLQGPESEYKPSLRLIERTPSHSDNPEIPKEPLSKRKSYEKEEIPEKKQKIEEIPEQRRKKKSRKDNNDSNNQRNVEGDNNMVGQSFGWSNQPTPICYEKNGREDLLEKQHIEDLKYEVNKLRSVVDLLREQQKLINSFDSGDKKVMNEQEMLDVLNQINNKKNPDPTDKNQANEIDVTEKAKHEDLARIKLQLQETIENLNRTKEILSLEHKKEMNLEEEMKNQKTEIGWLKLIIENFIIAQTKKRKEQSQEFKLIDTGNKTVNKTEDHIVRSRPPQSLASHHNHTIPSTVRMAEEN